MILRAFAFVLAAGLALPAVAQPTPACLPGDKPCIMRTMMAHPIKTPAFWQSALARPLAERIGPAPAELVAFLALDVAVNDLPHRPRASRPDPAFLADVRRAFDGLPAAIRKLLETKLAGIYFVDDFGGTGFTDSIDWKFGFIVLDPSVLARQSANAWATWKDNTPFRPDPAWRLTTRIAAPGADDRVGAIQFILLHEIGHVLSIGTKVHPDWNRSPGDAGGAQDYPFFALSWDINKGRYVSRFDAQFPQRPSVVFYFGARLEGREMLPVYEALEKTNFPTLYAATQPGDDFAESFASYVHGVMMGREHEVQIRENGKLRKSFGPCWGQPRCASKRTALESVLGLPPTR